MDKTRNKNWFEGSQNLQTNLALVKSSLDEIGQYFTAVVSLMPGLTEVTLMDQGDGFVTIRTNEGLMKRTNISVTSINDQISIEFDEEYEAGKILTTTGHFIHEFKNDGDSVLHSLVIRLQQAPGFLGFFYKNFGSKNIGKAFLEAHKQYLEHKTSD